MGKILDIIVNVSAILMVILIIVGSIFTITAPEDEPTNYTVYSTVIGKNEKLITVLDDNGNVWEYVALEETHKGDLICLVLTDNATKEIKDDEIVRAYNLSNLTR